MRCANKIRKGRSVQRISWKDDVILYLTGTSNEAGGIEAVEDMNDFLESIGVGRVISDPYELRRIGEMAVKFGETLHT